MSSNENVDFYYYHQRQSPPSLPSLTKSTPYIPLPTSEKSGDFDAQIQQEDQEQSCCRRRRCRDRQRCHSARLRRILVPVVVALVLLLGGLTMSVTFCAGGNGMTWLGRGAGIWLGETSDGTPDVALSMSTGVPEGTVVAYRRSPAPAAAPGPDVDAPTFLASLGSSLSSTSSTFASKRETDEPLAKRQSTGTPVNGPDQESTFTRKKLYLIIIFVGLFLVLVLGIMLSAWCCRSSFENPLCCPCYLCACCGGLACLECIGCGLCCEGINELTDD